MNELKFDQVLHLAGEQIIPNFMGIRACDSPLHILAVTERTAKQQERLGRELALNDAALSVLKVPPYDYPEIMRLIDERLSGFSGQRIGVNLTGGTKPMSAAALDVCRKRGFHPFYVDTQTRKIHLFDTPYLEIPLPSFFSEIRQFIGLADAGIGAPGQLHGDAIDMARARLIKDFWRNGKPVRYGIKDFAEASDNRFRDFMDPPDQFWRGYDQLKGWATRVAPGLAEHWNAVFPQAGGDWQRAAEFGRGGWFEEYVLTNLTGVEGLLDVRLGMTISFLDTYKQDNTLQELDVSYTTGYELVIVECKAGRVTQDHLQKLENLTLRLGGSFGRGVLVAIDPPDDLVRARISGSRLCMVCDQACNHLAARIREAKPGQVYTA